MQTTPHERAELWIRNSVAFHRQHVSVRETEPSIISWHANRWAKSFVSMNERARNYAEGILCAFDFDSLSTTMAQITSALNWSVMRMRKAFHCSMCTTFSPNRSFNGKHPGNSAWAFDIQECLEKGIRNINFSTREYLRVISRDIERKIFRSIETSENMPLEWRHNASHVTSWSLLNRARVSLINGFNVFYFFKSSPSRWLCNFFNKLEKCQNIKKEKVVVVAICIT